MSTIDLQACDHNSVTRHPALGHPKLTGIAHTAAAAGYSAGAFAELPVDLQRAVA